MSYTHRRHTNRFGKEQSRSIATGRLKQPLIIVPDEEFQYGKNGIAVSGLRRQATYRYSVFQKGKLQICAKYYVNLHRAITKTKSILRVS